MSSEMPNQCPKWKYIALGAVSASFVVGAVILLIVYSDDIKDFISNDVNNEEKEEKNIKDLNEVENSGENKWQNNEKQKEQDISENRGKTETFLGTLNNRGPYSQMYEPQYDVNEIETRMLGKTVHEDAQPNASVTKTRDLTETSHVR